MKKPRIIQPSSQHYVEEEKLKVLKPFSNRKLGVALVVVMTGIGWALVSETGGKWLQDVHRAENAPAWLRPLIQTVSYCWAGAVLAISFFEAPTKFTTTQASRASLLDVGRTIFFKFGRLELCFVSALNMLNFPLL